MLTQHQLTELREQDLLAAVRVVPVPLSTEWCVDVVVRRPMATGSITDTVASRADPPDDDELRTFPSIDAAAGFLASVGIREFVVDVGDSVAFTGAHSPGMRVVETTVRQWDAADGDDDDADVASAA